MPLMTEEEAREKWCPFARVMMLAPAPDHNPAVNRRDMNCHCIASGCMAWRWGDLPRDGNRFQPVTPRVGYCGLASKPEGG